MLSIIGNTVQIQERLEVTASLLEVRRLKEVYTARFGDMKAVALADTEFSVDRGEYAAIMGESGPGKTTPLDTLVALGEPTSGNIMLDGKDMLKIPDSCMAAYHRDNLRPVFQDFSLLGMFSIKDDIFLPMVLAKKDYHEMEERLVSPAKQLEIGDPLGKFLYKVSGGQKRRAAVARALITKSWLLLADEPTGALNSRVADGLPRILKAVNRSGQTALMVTHSTRAVSHVGRVLFIKDGIVSHQLYHETCTNREIYQKISDTLTVLTTRGREEGRNEQRA